MSDPSFFGGNPFHGRLYAASSWLTLLGSALVIVGLAAIAFPFFSTVAATLLAGWVLVITGFIAFLGAFSIHGTGPFFGALLFGLLSFAAGLFLLANPLQGAVALTLIVGVMFMFQGAFETVFALEMRPLRHWGSMLISGIASIVIAVIIILGWPEISVLVLGILLGVNFLTTGLAYIFASHALKR